MTTEEKLKELILQRYRSLREFIQVIDMPYSTMDSILKRGLENASITNILKICRELGISADELAEGRFVPYENVRQNQSQMSDISDIVKVTKTKLMNYDNLTVDGVPASQEDVELLTSSLDVCMELIRKRKAQ